MGYQSTHASTAYIYMFKSTELNKNKMTMACCMPDNHRHLNISKYFYIYTSIYLLLWSSLSYDTSRNVPATGSFNLRSQSRDPEKFLMENQNYKYHECLYIYFYIHAIADYTCTTTVLAIRTTTGCSRKSLLRVQVVLVEVLFTKRGIFFCVQWYVYNFSTILQ